MRWLAILLAPLLWLVAPVAIATAQQQPADIQAGLCTGANLEITDTPSSTSCGGGTDATTALNNLVKNLINLFSVAVGIIAVIMIIIGGLRYITSGGNDTSVTGAKNTILYAIIGLIIVALAQLIVRFTLSKVTSS